MGERQPGAPSATALLRLSPSAVVALDPEGRITTLNHAAESLLGVTSAAAAGRSYSEVFGPSLSDRLLRLFLRVGHAAGQSETIAATLPSGRRAVLRASAGPIVGPAGAVVGVLFVAEDRTELEETARAQRTREEHLREALRRYAGEAAAAQVEEHPSLVGIGGQTRTISALHADARGYSTFAEQHDPAAVMDTLIRYHGAVVEALTAWGATVDRYVGDAVLAMWNAPHARTDHARAALLGALALQRAALATGQELRYGVGVHTGEAVVGNLGSERYLHYTAIGDTVNVAARLQAAAEGGSVVCSATTLEAAGPGVQARALGALDLKGRRTAVEAFLVEGVPDAPR